MNGLKTILINSTEVTLFQIPIHNMTGLKVLNVSHNVIQTIPKGTFPKLYELHTVDVSHNNLSNVSKWIFTRFCTQQMVLEFNKSYVQIYR